MSKEPIIVFDAMCVLCSYNTQFILKYDKDHYFKLASMQGAVGTSLYQKFDMDPNDPDTLIIVEGDDIKTDSDAVIFIYSKLGWPWRIMVFFSIIPRFIRDPIYRFIARNRYRIFGHRNECWLPKPEDAKRIL